MVLVRADRLWEAVGSESVRIYRQIDIVAPRIVSDFPPADARGFLSQSAEEVRPLRGEDAAKVAERDGQL